ncbi:hypothetical protein D9M71_228070 [compost metagenome]
MQFLEALQTGLGLGLATLGALAHPLQFGLHGLGMGGFLLGFLGQARGLGFQPAGVVAFERDALAAVEFENPAGDVVEEVAVVGDRHHGAREVVEEVFQPGDRVGVQVVGRFVQQQHVRSGQQQTTQRHAALLATGEVFDLRVPCRQAQRIGGDFQLTLEVVAVGSLDDGFQLGLLGGQRVEVGVRLGVGGVDLVQTGLGLFDLANGFFDDIADGGLRVELRLLRQVADVDARHRAGFALDLGVDARHDAQQGGFTRAVQAEHADLGAGEERQGNVLEDFTLGRNDLADPVHGVDVLSQIEDLYQKCRKSRRLRQPQQGHPSTNSYADCRRCRCQALVGCVTEPSILREDAELHSCGWPLSDHLQAGTRITSRTTTAIRSTAA